MRSIGSTKDQGNFGKRTTADLTLATSTSPPNVQSMTKQATDYIVIDGNEYPLQNQPLSEYLSTCAPMLEFRDRPSFNWRGYVARWKMQDDNLYLTDIFGCLQDGVSVTVKSLFPFADGPVRALWCNETLQVPCEERQGGGGWTYCSRYQREMLLTIDAGKVTETVQRDIEMA